MLNKKFRATKKHIKETMEKGFFLHGDNIYAKISQKDYKKTLFAIIVGKKDCKTSVGRHTIKRKISSFLESKIGFFDKIRNKTVVFILKKTTGQIDYVKIKEDIEGIFKKLQV